MGEDGARGALELDLPADGAKACPLQPKLEAADTGEEAADGELIQAAPLSASCGVSASMPTTTAMFTSMRNLLGVMVWPPRQPRTPSAARLPGWGQAFATLR